MDKDSAKKWFDEIMPLHARLEPAVVTILQSVLKVNGIDYLAITGRTKTQTSALDKIERKNYQNPSTQMTDLTGVRVVLYFESDVKRVASLIEETFSVDRANSLNQDDVLKADQTGYRSVHFVCDLGEGRTSLPEFNGLANLKFEIQVRTVLQHAWAELSHDRNYKFEGRLPRELERKLYLYAGLLEIADKGFDELSKSIDDYAASIEAKAEEGQLDEELDSISLPQFVRKWAERNSVELSEKPSVDNYARLLDELNQFKVHTLRDLNSIIPKDVIKLAKNTENKMTIPGLVRIWMLKHDPKRFDRDVKREWSIYKHNSELWPYFTDDEFQKICEMFGPKAPSPSKGASTSRKAAKGSEQSE